MKQLLILAIVFILGAVSANVVSEFRLDGNLEVQCSVRPQNITFIGKSEFVPGIDGQALVLSNSKPQQGFEFLLPDGLDPIKGAISFWLCPLNWRYDDKSFQIFLGGFLGTGAATEKTDLQTPDRFFFYKYGNPNMNSGGLGMPWLFYKDNKAIHGAFVDGRKMGSWVEHKWHFVVLEWDRSGPGTVYRIWVDAERVGGFVKDIDLSGPVKLRFGACWGDAGGRTAIDNVCIHNTPPAQDRQLEIYEAAMEKIYSAKEIEKGNKK